MANDKDNDMIAVAISAKANELARQEKDRRFEQTGVKMTVGAIVSEAVFKAFGNNG